MSRFLRLIPALLLIVFTGALPAQTAEDSYKQIPILGQAGEDKLQKGDTTGAIADFKKAFELSRDLGRQYPQEQAYTENAYFYLGRLATAFGNAKDIPHALEMAEPSARGYSAMAAANATPENIENATSAFGRLAWFQVLANQPKAAEESARKALELTPGHPMVQVNLAHALLLNGKFDEAKALYLAEPTGATSDGRTWRDVILEDFNTMEAAGIHNNGIAQIRKNLGGGKVLAATHGQKKDRAVWPFILLVGLLIGAVFAILMYFDRKRTAKLEANAKALGFTFRRKATPEDKQLTAGSQLATLGKHRNIRNIVEVPLTEGTRMTLFDFSYAVGHGKRSRTFEQTVTRIQTPLANLPAFDLRPESILAKIVQSLGYKDIDIAGWPNFSKMFSLRGKDDAAIRAFFTASILKFCEQNRTLWISAGGDLLWFHHENRRFKPDELGAFVASAKETAALLRSDQSETAPPIPPPPLPPPPLPTV